MQINNFKKNLQFFAHLLCLHVIFQMSFLRNEEVLANIQVFSQKHIFVKKILNNTKCLFKLLLHLFYLHSISLVLLHSVSLRLPLSLSLSVVLSLALFMDSLSLLLITLHITVYDNQMEKVPPAVKYLRWGKGKFLEQHNQIKKI